MNNLPGGLPAAPGLAAPVGLGAPAGLGCSDYGSLGPLGAGVWAMLAAGSPRLALAKALGVPLAPYFVNVRATFTDTATPLVPGVGSKEKIYQDTLIDALIVRVFNTSETANQNIFQSQSDYFFAIQGGLEATLSVQGQPRYEVADDFTPLSTLSDMIGPSHWPGGWILTYDQQLFMDFRTTIALPTAPITVVCSFRGWLPVTTQFAGVGMSNKDAMDQLENNFGLRIPAAYRARPGR